MKEFEFKCSCCGETHKGIPTFGWDFPLHLLDIPEVERESRVLLGSDDCIIDERWFYVRGCIEIPVIGHKDPFIWGAWVSLSEKNHTELMAYFGVKERAHIGPYFGWLSVDFRPYSASCLNLKTYVHIRNEGVRPYIELESTDHPLAIEQKNGITPDRVAEIYEIMVHGKETAA